MSDCPKMDLDAQEATLINELLFYKIHREQLVRIKALEMELDEEKQGIEEECKKRRAAAAIDNIRNDALEVCKRNMQEAFTDFKYQVEHHKRMHQSHIMSTPLRINKTEVQGACKYQLSFSFVSRGEDAAKVKCSVGNQNGHTFVFEGQYSATGFVLDA